MRRHYKWVEVPKMKGDATHYMHVPKEEHEITDEDRAWAKQCDIDWMWWCFLIGTQIADLARDLEKDPEKVKRMIQRIIDGEAHTTIEDIDVVHLDNRPWTPRQEKILLRLREASCSPVRAGKLLSRSTSSVKRKIQILSTSSDGQQRLPI